MRYWPMSVIRTSPLLPGDCAAELHFIFAKLMSTRTLQACEHVANQTQSVNADGLVVMEGDPEVPYKLVYTQRPTQEQWERLERTVIIDAPGNALVFFMDPLQ